MLTFPFPHTERVFIRSASSKSGIRNRFLRNQFVDRDEKREFRRVAVTLPVLKWWLLLVPVDRTLRCFRTAAAVLVIITLRFRHAFQNRQQEEAGKREACGDEDEGRQ